jgi:endonuclease I
MPFRRIKYCLFSLILGGISLAISGQPAGYYDPAAGLTGSALQQALHDIIKNHTSVTYGDLWTHFQTTDKKSDGKVWDMYSDIPSGTPAYLYTFVTNQCGEYNSEGDCYNREHSFPKSWFGGEISPMYTDLFHLYPTDGWVNGKRGNLPFGITSSATWISTNGSKLGDCSYTGYSEEIFEPVNAYKGDFARTYFYMAVRYYDEDSAWPGSDMVTGSQLKPWALKMLMEWDIADPVSQKETDRNNAVYTIQGNRNPFIDNTSYAYLIWGSPTDIEDPEIEKDPVKVWPNPANETITIKLNRQLTGNYTIRIVNVSGRIIMDKSAFGNPVTLDLTSFETGYYIIIITGRNSILSIPLIIAH